MGNYQIREDTYQEHTGSQRLVYLLSSSGRWLARPTGWHVLGVPDTFLPLTPVRLHALEAIVPFSFSFLFVPYFKFGPVTRCFTGIDGSLLGTGTVLYDSVHTVICRVVDPQKPGLPFYVGHLLCRLKHDDLH